MPVIQEESGIHDRLLRPLCAKNLTETLPEREGWVNRAQLYDFHGRSRKPQMALAQKFSFEDYAQPAGGCCFLTDEQYSVKLSDMWQSRGEKRYELDDIMLLKVGRHVRPKPNFKLIIAREAGETKFMRGYRKQYPSLVITSHGGPWTLIDGELSEDDLMLSAQIAARYSQGRDAEQVDFDYINTNGDVRQLSVKPMHPDDIDKAWVL